MDERVLFVLSLIESAREHVENEWDTLVFGAHGIVLEGDEIPGAGSDCGDVEEFVSEESVGEPLDHAHTVFGGDICGWRDSDLVSHVRVRVDVQPVWPLSERDD